MKFGTSKYFKKWHKKSFKGKFKNFYDEPSLACGWNSCQQEILKLFKHPKINQDNLDIKYLIEEIEKL